VRVVWKPDGAILVGWEKIGAAALTGMLRRHAALAPGVTCEVRDERTGAAGRACYPGGLGDFLTDQTTVNIQRIESPPLSVAGEHGGVRVAAALQVQPWAEQPCWFESFANGAPTEMGGTHARGFWRGLQDALTDLAAAKGIGPAEGLKLRPRDLRHAFHGAVAVWLERPIYNRSTRAELGDPRAGKAVRTVLRGELPAQIRKNGPDILEWLRRQAG
jgi:DNA gyrase/topoisomerase IV subunit B